MELKILGSESSGNLYLLTSDTGETLILEAGIRVQEVKQALDFDLSNVNGLIVSHLHQDHAKYAKDYAKAGIMVYSHESTLERTKVGYRGISIEHGKLFHAGSFSIIPITVPHGGVQCFGFLISHPESGKILFVTDAQFIPHRFNNLTHILIEANYSDEANTTGHGIGAHMALDTTLKFIQANNPHNLRNVVLLHLSATNSNEKEFIRQVKSVAPHADVTVADKGVTVNLNIHPF